MKKDWEVNTKVIHDEMKPDQLTKSLSPAVIPAVAYSFESLQQAMDTVSGEVEGNYYGRYGNPTIERLEKKIANLEEAEAALAFSSGMAAISSALLNYLHAGDHVIVTKDVYGGTYHFLTNLAPRLGIETDFVDCTNVAEVESKIKQNTKVLYLETPSNPCLTILDLKSLTAVARKNNLSVIVDNTFMTPVFQKPLLLGADLVVHSGTKYLNGHGDVLAGFIAGSKKDIAYMRKNLMGDLGQNLNSWEAFLILRGLKTLGVRLAKHVHNANEIAAFLHEHPEISTVYYPGLKSHPNHELAKSQMKEMGAIISFELKGGFSQAEKFINSLQLIMISFSLGDPETLIQHPASMTHFSIPEKEREASGITTGLVRLSVGLEDTKDLKADIQQALEQSVENPSLS